MNFKKSFNCIINIRLGNLNKKIYLKDDKYVYLRTIPKRREKWKESGLIRVKMK